MTLVVGFLVRGAGYGALGGSVLGAAYAASLVTVAGSSEPAALGAAATLGMFFGGPAGLALGTVSGALLAAMCVGAPPGVGSDAHRLRSQAAGAVALGVVGLGFGSVLWWHPPANAVPLLVVVPTGIAALYGAWAARRVADWFLVQGAPVRATDPA